LITAKVTPVALLILLPGLLLVPALAQNQQDKVAIRNIVQEEVAAWDKGDAVSYSRHFAADGTFTNVMGTFFEGHEVFVEQHDHIFQTIFRGSKLQQDVISLQFVTPDVAVVNILTAVSGTKIPNSRADNFDAKGRLRTRLLQVFVRRNGAWQIVAYHNVEVKDARHLPEPK
jgi:uncharacterized protein (TIGR02246 family)